jgi:ABC-2 type transport system permease protein
VVTSNSDWFAAIGHGGLGFVLFIISANRVGIAWTPHLIIYYILALFGGVLIQGAVFLFFATLCFYIVKSDNLREMLYWNLRRFAGYPISIFHKYIQWLLMYIIPFAFVNYFPAQYLLRKQDMRAYPEIYIYMAPFVGIVMSTFAYLFWRFSVRYYKSTGN